MHCESLITLLRGQVLLLDGGHDHIIRIDHFVEVNLSDLGEEFIGVELGEAVVFVNPVHEFGEGNAEGVVEGAVGADRHDGVVVLKLRPGDGAAFDYAQLHAGFERNFDGGAGDFSVAHGGMAVANVEQAAFYVHWKINCVADAGFGRIHVASEFGWDYGTARLTLGGCDSDAAEERMEGNFHREI